MRRDSVIKSIQETPTAEMESNDVAIHDLNMTSKKNITDNFVRRQTARAKDSLMSGIELNDSIVEATRRGERKSFEGVIINDETTLSSSIMFSDVISDLL